MLLMFHTLAYSLPNAALAFAILLLISLSMTTFWDSVLLKYVHLFTTFNLWPLALTLGSMYSWLMHYFSLFDTDGKAEVTACIKELVDA